jgi:hypothetical protein
MGTPRRSTRVAALAAAAPSPSATPPPTKKQSKKSSPSSTKKGLRGQEAPDTAAPLGDVDPQSGFGQTAVIVQDDEGSEAYNVMLNLIDLSQNMDKYYILQVKISCARHLGPVMSTAGMFAPAPCAFAVIQLLLFNYCLLFNHC